MSVNNQEKPSKQAICRVLQLVDILVLSRDMLYEFKDVSFNKIEQDYICCDTDLVIKGTTKL